MLVTASIPAAAVAAAAVVMGVTFLSGVLMLVLAGAMLMYLMGVLRLTGARFVIMFLSLTVTKNIFFMFIHRFHPLLLHVPARR